MCNCEACRNEFVWSPPNCVASLWWVVDEEVDIALFPIVNVSFCEILWGVRSAVVALWEWSRAATSPAILPCINSCPGVHTMYMSGTSPFWSFSFTSILGAPVKYTLLKISTSCLGVSQYNLAILAFRVHCSNESNHCRFCGVDVFSRDCCRA